MGPRQTIDREVAYSGKGLFSGEAVNLRLVPCFEGKGIRFRRVDKPGSKEIPALLPYVSRTPRCVVLANEGNEVWCVEHILSALKGLGIDDLVVELDCGEVPIGDGSASWMMELLEKTKIVPGKGVKEVLYLQEPQFFSRGETHLVALPSKELRYSCVLSYTKHPLLDSQYFDFINDVEVYKSEVAPSRTFALYEELEMLLQGHVKGGSLESAIVVKDKEILNPGGLRFQNEFVRHKVLDFIGDLSLLGYNLVAHYIAIKAGHKDHVEFARTLRK